MRGQYTEFQKAVTTTWDLALCPFRPFPRAAVFPTHRVKSGPKAPSRDLIRAVIDMKPRNPSWGCPRIEQIALAFGVVINKDVVGRILAAHYHPSADGPSWLTFLGHMNDSLYSS